jgi:hypothetical protein
LLHGKDGIVETTKTVKQYIHAAFGKVSDQFKQFGNI